MSVSTRHWVKLLEVGGEQELIRDATNPEVVLPAGYMTDWRITSVSIRTPYCNEVDEDMCSSDTCSRGTRESVLCIRE